jgi:hypothetical protein
MYPKEFETWREITPLSLYLPTKPVLTNIIIVPHKLLRKLNTFNIFQSCPKRSREHIYGKIKNLVST